MQLITRSHGGYCCGIRHFPAFGWNARTKEQLEKIINSYTKNCRVRGILFEVVLTDSQLRTSLGKKQLEWLNQIGFTLVSRFINKNSGNTCNVFHYTPFPLSLDPKDLPFKWENKNG